MYPLYLKDTRFVLGITASILQKDIPQLQPLCIQLISHFCHPQKGTTLGPKEIPDPPSHTELSAFNSTVMYISGLFIPFKVGLNGRLSILREAV
jgi:hypothetical protein